MIAHSLNLMSDNQKGYVFRQLPPFKRKDPLDDVIPKETPQLLNKLLKLLDTHSIMKTTVLIDIFGLPASELNSITQLSASELTQSDNVISFILREK